MGSLYIIRNVYLIISQITPNRLPPIAFGNPYFDGLPFFLQLLIIALFLALLAYFLRKALNAAEEVLNKKKGEFKDSPFGIALGVILGLLKKLWNFVFNWLKNIWDKIRNWIKRNPKVAAAIAAVALPFLKWLKPFFGLFKFTLLGFLKNIFFILFIAGGLFLSYPLYAPFFSKTTIFSKLISKILSSKIESQHFILEWLNKFNSFIQSFLMGLKGSTPFWAFSFISFVFYVTAYFVPAFILLTIIRKFIVVFLAYIDEKKKLEKIKKDKKTFGMIKSVDKSGEIVYTADQEKMRKVLSEQEDATKKRKESIIPLAVMLSFFFNNLKNITI